MPELPDLETYVRCLQSRIVGQALRAARVVNPFLLRTVEPPLEAFEGRTVAGVRRMTKRVVLEFAGDSNDPADRLYLVVHLMIAGRFQWKPAAAMPKGRTVSAWFRFDSGTLVLTEAATRKRAALHAARGEASVLAGLPGGLEPLEIDAIALAGALRRENRTLKRALTDPRTLSGIGNAYSDEILHAARLSPLALTRKLSEADVAGLHAAMQRVLRHWIELLAERFARRFPGPGDVTAFRPEFAVHGRYGQPCPECRAKIQRIRRAENEINYCPRCQTGGRILADRSLSRLLGDGRPRTIEELDDE